ncbi:endolytic transglycosylase MltG [Shewanella sp. NIFS-20-20]|uniref:endolytic transglycosylase MltG n=1 Tax=Shewanella sp. NIFS-20-20 TaxID=2853806 RepID=UPI001C44A43D|nr:endolytic transglycosylase MltG [Shewanella sp. NIFS-20-20]MBV7314596.1 endolytic transglycosylase MltG [Shewanella sp. NIFS-20-20]
MLKKIIIRIFVSLMTLTTIALFAGAWAYMQVQAYLQQPLQISSPQEIVIPAGSNLSSLDRQWRQLGWIEGDEWLLKVAVRLEPAIAAVKSGVYEISAGMSLSQLISTLNQGDEKHFSLSLIDGQTINQWQASLANSRLIVGQSPFQAVLDKAGDTRAPEGLFYPDTYHYTADENAAVILEQSYQKMQAALANAWQHRADDVPLSSPYELLILASIIEKETAKASEREWIAAVFANRLKRGMRLQTDPTVIYGMGERYNGNITRADLREKTVYNTYRINGLPPTPIAAPSEASLLAAAHPADVDYLYFVSRNDGSHVFSKTLVEHNRAVNEYQRKK